jgi:electron transport complex protein RnfD
MLQVLLATLPGIAALVYFFGWGLVVNICLTSLTAVLCEAAVLRLRTMPVLHTLSDYSALVSAVLLAIALPPYCPWWIAVSGSAFAILIAKHVYGGLGYNPFNPAMVGYVFLLISFPVEMTAWSQPLGANNAHNISALIDAINYSFNDQYQALTSATPLDIWRLNMDVGLTELKQSETLFGYWGGIGWEQANWGFAFGGLYLLYRKIFTWHAPIGFLSTIAVLCLVSDPANFTHSLLFHWFSGATMLGAFFIITDPVSSTVSNPARLLYGIGAGLLLFVIRTWSNYPDAVAFAVLLMNFVAPLIDHYFQPRVYGHR